MTGITEHLNRLNCRISKALANSGRGPDDAQLLAVSKRHDMAAILDAAANGLTDFGENYVSEAVEKIKTAPPELNWHFIGRIQSNKTREIATHFDWVQTVDRAKIARRLNEQRPDDAEALQVLIQVQTDPEDQHGGVSPGELAGLAQLIDELPRLQLRGLMCIPAPSTNIEQQQKPFRLMKELFSQLQSDGHDIDTLSMGMSNDLEAAIIEGSTMVRIGTDLFGPRPT